MGKDNTVLMVGLGVLAGYILMPEKIRENLVGGVSGGGTFPTFPGWGNLIKIPDFPGWGKLIPEINVPTFPEVPDFPGWEVLLGGVPTPEEIIDIVTDPLPDSIIPTGWIPSKENIEAMLKTFLGGMEFPNPIDLIPETPDKKSGDQRTFTEKLFGLEHSAEGLSVWDRWVRRITGNYDIMQLGEKSLDITGAGKEPTLGETIKAALFDPKYIYGENAKASTETPSISENAFPANEPTPSKSYDVKVPSEIATPVNTSSVARNYRARSYSTKTKSYTTRDLSSAMRYGGGT